MQRKSCQADGRVKRERGSIPQTTSLTIQFSWAWLWESSRSACCPISKLGWTIRASLMFSQENPPTIVYFDPRLWTKWKKSYKNINLKRGDKRTRRKVLVLMISLSLLKTCMLALSLSFSLSSRSHSLGAHFVFSPIRIHQQSTLLHTPRKH